MGKFRVLTDKPIAYDSPDHTHPFGVKHNNSHNQEFNDKLYQLFPKPLRLLDLGCAGGHSVKKFLEQGNYALGLEGSDYRIKHNLPEWNNNPDFLFLCDVTSDFTIEENNGGVWEKAIFDVITAWEFLEHLGENDLPKLYDKIKEYLAPGGAWIVSICVFDEERSKKTYGKEWGNKEDFPDMGLHHQWCVPREWWYKNLEDNGFVLNEDKLRHFQGKFVRGPGINAGHDCTINLYIEVKK